MTKYITKYLDVVIVIIMILFVIFSGLTAQTSTTWRRITTTQPAVVTTSTPTTWVPATIPILPGGIPVCACTNLLEQILAELKKISAVPATTTLPTIIIPSTTTQQTSTSTSSSSTSTKISTTTTTTTYPIGLDPIIYELTPPSAAAGGPLLVLGVLGSGFNSSSVIIVDGLALSTLVNSGSILQGMLPASAISTMGEKVVYVLNGNGRASNSISFLVTTGTVPPSTAPTTSSSSSTTSSTTAVSTTTSSTTPGTVRLEWFTADPKYLFLDSQSKRIYLTGAGFNIDPAFGLKVHLGGIGSFIVTITGPGTGYVDIPGIYLDLVGYWDGVPPESMVCYLFTNTSDSEFYFIGLVKPYGF